MCNKAVDDYPNSLDFLPECYKTQNVCDKAVDSPPSAIQFIPEYYKAQEMCHNVVHRCFLYLILFLINIINLKKYVT